MLHVLSSYLSIERKYAQECWLVGVTKLSLNYISSSEYYGSYNIVLISTFESHGKVYIFFPRLITFLKKNFTLFYLLILLEKYEFRIFCKTLPLVLQEVH